MINQRDMEIEALHNELNNQNNGQGTISQYEEALNQINEENTELRRMLE